LPEPPEKKPAPEDKGKKPTPDAPEKKPEAGDKKGEERKPDLAGVVKAVSGDGTSLPLLGPPMGKNPEPTAIDSKIAETSTIIDDNELGTLKVGQTVYVWLGKGERKVAMGIRIDKPTDKPAKKPAPEDKGKKPPPDAPGKKPDDKKPSEKKPEATKTAEKKPV